MKFAIKLKMLYNKSMELVHFAALMVHRGSETADDYPDLEDDVEARLLSDATNDADVCRYLK